MWLIKFETWKCSEVKDLTFFPSAVVFQKTYFTFLPSRAAYRQIHSEYFNHCLTKQIELVLLWAQLTKIYPPLPTSVQPISITKTLLIVPTKNVRDPPLFTGKLLMKFQNILRNTTQVIIQHRVKILFSVISSPITLEQQKWKSSKMKGILLSSPVNSW
jgi:two-component sensor histidine kinase